MDVGRKGRNDNSAIACHLEQFVKRLSYCALARRAARHLHIGGIRQKCQNALFTQLSKTTQINDAAFNRSIINLKVSSLYNNAGWSMNCHRTSIRNRVVYPNKFHRHTACLDNVSWFYFGHANLIAQSMLFELVFNQSHCQFGCIQWSVDLLHQIRNAADMVLMSMGDKDTADLFLVLNNIGEIRDNDINAQHGFIRKSKTAVNDEHIVSALIHGHVFSDLI